MKYISLLIVIGIVSVLFLTVCKYNNHTDNTPCDFEWLRLDNSSKTAVYIRYKYPINGYNITAVCLVDTAFNNDCPSYKVNNMIFGKAYIHFIDDKREFIIENESFSENINFDYKQITDGTLLELDYKFSSDSYVFNSIDVPFFFWDIDFDGEKELISSVYNGMGYHWHNSYNVYKICHL